MTSNGNKGSWEERLYLWLLGFSRDLADVRQDVFETFCDLRRETRRAHGPGAARWVVTRSLLAMVVLLLRESFQRRLHPAPWQPDPRSRRNSPMFVTLGSDLRLALRHLERRPTFALSVILIVALGVGATTAIFSVVDHVLLRPLPYSEVDRLVLFTEGHHPGPLYEAWQERTHSFEALEAVWSEESRALTGDGPPQELMTGAVTPGFLPLFDAQIERGRLLTEADMNDRARVLVLDHGLWQQRWGGDPSILGRALLLDGEPWTVVGILGPEFVPPEALVGRRVDIWIPLQAHHPWLDAWHFHLLGVAGRLKPDAGLEAAQAELDTLAGHLAEQHPERRRHSDDRPKLTPLVPLGHATVGEVQGTLSMLLGAVTLMLLIGCANIANLFLARGTDQRREMALRAALGAQRRRLAGQTLTESLTLAGLGGILGIGLAYLGLRAFPLVLPAGIPRTDALAIDPRILAFALGLTLATGLLFGLLPAFQSAGTRVGEALKAGGERGTASGRSLRDLLVVSEVALALVLLIGAGLLFHSMILRLENEVGFEPEGVLRLSLQLPTEYEESKRLRLSSELLEKLEAVPGVTRAAGGWTLPFDFYGNSHCCWSAPLKSDPEIESQRTSIHPVTANFFQTLEARLVAGRELVDRDGKISPTPAVVNQTLARRLFPDRDPIGQRVFFDSKNPGDMVVVGVVEDVRHYGFEAEDSGAFYLPFSSHGEGVDMMRLALRTEIPFSAELAQRLREVVWSVDPDLPIPEVAPLEQQMARSLREPRFYSLLLASFAGLALLLAAVGIASALLYNVGQRHRELGIRFALGARAADLRRMILRQGLGLTSLGLGLGLVGAALLSRFLEKQVYGITPLDPLTFGSVSLFLLAVALTACWLPARRASQVDPMETLRRD